MKKLIISCSILLVFIITLCFVIYIPNQATNNITPLEILRNFIVVLCITTLMIIISYANKMRLTNNIDNFKPTKLIYILIYFYILSSLIITLYLPFFFIYNIEIPNLVTVVVNITLGFVSLMLIRKNFLNEKVKLFVKSIKK